MFESSQYSGFLLCYGPLALVIVGFIAFAALTDSQARSKYLRRLDPRPDGERHDEPVALTAPVVARTPAGMLVALMPSEEVPAMPDTRMPQTAVAAKPDNLQLIEGIGPKIAQIMKDAGINTFAALAAKSATELRAILDEAGISAISDPTTWPEQAGLAARGEWEALEELQENLKGGRA